MVADEGEVKGGVRSVNRWIALATIMGIGLIVFVNWGLVVLFNKLPLPTCADWLADHPEVTAAQLSCHNYLQEVVPLVLTVLIAIAYILIVLKLMERGVKETAET